LLVVGSFHSTISEKERERDTERLGLNDNK